MTGLAGWDMVESEDGWRWIAPGIPRPGDPQRSGRPEFWICASCNDPIRRQRSSDSGSLHSPRRHRPEDEDLPVRCWANLLAALGEAGVADRPGNVHLDEPGPPWVAEDEFFVGGLC